MNVADEIVYSTSRIEAFNADKKIGSGTAFFFMFLAGDDAATPALVTNKHVLKGAAAIEFTISLADSKGEVAGFQRFRINDLARVSFWHPDLDVDLEHFDSRRAHSLSS